MPLPTASLSIDLDNLWAYLKTQGTTGWESFPTYLDKVVPRILESLEKQGLKATFFIVGKDAEDPRNAAALKQIATAGHEIGNHSYLHEPWLHLYSDAELKADFDRSETAIEAVTGQRPIGFRGPGFSSSPAVIDELVARGYRYDASVFPTFLGPIARLYFSLGSKLSPEEKAKRSGLYGGFANALKTLKPYALRPGLTEVPVSTMPLFRVPVHLSYVMFLAARSEALARAYWHMAVTLFRLRGIGPSILLHPTDYLDLSDAPEMAFFPAMKVPATRKRALVDMALHSLATHWRTGPVGDHAAQAFTSTDFQNQTRTQAAFI